MHINKTYLSQEIDRLSNIIKSHREILITKNIMFFPEIEILDEYESAKEEYEDEFEDIDKSIPKMYGEFPVGYHSTKNSARTEKKKYLVSRKYFLRVSHLDQESREHTSTADRYCEWPTCMRNKQIDKKLMADSDSTSNCSKDTKSKGRLSKNQSAKKQQVVVKKVMNRVMYYSEMEIQDDVFFKTILKTLSFGKERKKPTAKQEKSLGQSLCKYHGEVHNHYKDVIKNTELILNKKN